MIIEKLKNSIRIKAKEATFLIQENTLKIGDLIIDSPGEYEKSGIFIETPKPGVFLIRVEDLRLLYALESASPELGGPDVLLTNNKRLATDLEPKNIILLDKLTKITIKDGIIRKT